MDQNSPKWRRVWEMRSPWLYQGYHQMIMYSVVALAVVGILNTFSGIGELAVGNVQMLQAASILLYLSFAVTSFVGAAIVLKIGPKWSIAFASLSYIFFTGLSLASPRMEATLGWKVGYIVVTVVSGIGAGLFWISLAPMVLGFAPATRKGHYIWVFWSIFNLGACIGGLITFGVTFSDGDGNVVGQVAPGAIRALIALQILGAIAAFVVIVNPNRVTREDGLEVHIPKPHSFKKELMECLEIAKNKDMLLLSPWFFMSNFFYAYLFTMNGTFFNTRTIGLNMTLYWSWQILGSIGLGSLLDASFFKNLLARGNSAFLIVSIAMALSWVNGVLFHLEALQHKNKQDLIDFTEPEWIWAFFVFMIDGISQSFVQVFVYWYISAVGGSDCVFLARCQGYQKSIQSLGASISWVIIYLSAWPLIYSAYINIAIFIVATVPAFFAVQNLRHVNLGQWKGLDKELAARRNSTSIDGITTKQDKHSDDPLDNGQTQFQVDPGTKVAFPSLNLIDPAMLESSNNMLVV